MLTLGSRELLSLHGDEREEVETVCHYCNKKYVFTKWRRSPIWPARQRKRRKIILEIFWKTGLTNENKSCKILNVADEAKQNV